MKMIVIETENRCLVWVEILSERGNDGVVVQQKHQINYLSRILVIRCCCCFLLDYSIIFPTKNTHTFSPVVIYVWIDGALAELSQQES